MDPMFVHVFWMMVAITFMVRCIFHRMSPVVLGLLILAGMLVGVWWEWDSTTGDMMVGGLLGIPVGLGMFAVVRPLGDAIGQRVEAMVVRVIGRK